MPILTQLIKYKALIANSNPLTLIVLDKIGVYWDSYRRYC